MKYEVINTSTSTLKEAIDIHNRNVERWTKDQPIPRFYLLRSQTKIFKLFMDTPNSFELTLQVSDNDLRNNRVFEELYIYKESGLSYKIKADDLGTIQITVEQTDIFRDFLIMDTDNFSYVSRISVVVESGRYKLHPQPIVMTNLLNDGLVSDNSSWSSQHLTLKFKDLQDSFVLDDSDVQDILVNIE